MDFEMVVNWFDLWLGAAAIAWLSYCVGSRRAQNAERENKLLRDYSRELTDALTKVVEENRRLNGKLEVNSHAG